MAVQEIASVAEFDSALRSAAGKPVFVQFFATWCGPCRQSKPIFDKASEQTTDATFLRVDIGKLAPLTTRYDIKSVPTFVVIKGAPGERERKSGFQSLKELSAMVRGWL